MNIYDNDNIGSSIMIGTWWVIMIHNGRSHPHGSRSEKKSVATRCIIVIYIGSHCHGSRCKTKARRYMMIYHDIYLFTFSWLKVQETVCRHMINYHGTYSLIFQRPRPKNKSVATWWTIMNYNGRLHSHGSKSKNKTVPILCAFPSPVIRPHLLSITASPCWKFAW